MLTVDIHITINMPCTSAPRPALCSNESIFRFRSYQQNVTQSFLFLDLSLSLTLLNVIFAKDANAKLKTH